jgi:hypothetical protein
MTAEVLILNKSAVAVAADSAVTVGKNKVHISGDKIFQICDKTPIGLMNGLGIFGIHRHAMGHSCKVISKFV